MDTLLKKLNYKNQKQILVLNAPIEFQDFAADWSRYAEIQFEVSANAVHFALIFVSTQEQIGTYINEVGEKLEGDAILWMCYPKASSKKYKCDFNRDTGWSALGNYQLEGVRQVAINDDWSALRFRKVSYIKTLKRKFNTISVEGKQKQIENN